MYKKLLFSIIVSCLGLSTIVNADVRIDIKNELRQDCSVAINARTDKTTWITTGWYVFMAGEEAPIIVEGANNVQDIYLYHDCDQKILDSSEKKSVWVKKHMKFKDEIPRDNAEGYEEKTFERLTTERYVIS